MSSKTKNNGDKASTGIEFSCIPVKQGNRQFYMFEALASTLKDLLAVSRREEDKDQGYQRHFSQSRVRAISQYIDQGNPIPLSLLVTFDDGVFSERKGTIFVPQKNDAGWIIDGQHRFLGAINARNDTEIPVVAFLGLDEEEQIHQFITINKEAKGVPTSLYYDLLPRLRIKKTPAELAKERAGDIAQTLRKDEDSAFFGRIVVTTSPKKGELSLNNFIRKVTTLVNEQNGVLATYGEHEQAKIIDNFYKGLGKVFPREYSRVNSKFFQTLGFGALMNFLPYFFSATLKDRQGFTVDDVAAMFKEVSHFDFGAWSSYGTGNNAERQAGEDLKVEFDAALRTKEGEGGIKL